MDAEDKVGKIQFVAQHRWDGDEELEDPGHLVDRHEDKEEVAHPLVQVVVQVEKAFGPGQNF